tara:strand:+ start:967 stop:1467 length:501 start_codon:yes stop_codon:yes gene_type:complete
VDIESKRQNKFIKKVTSWKFLFFLLYYLPMALLAGLKIKKLSNDIAEVTVPFKFLNKNPFNSIYFAVLTMAAELSTGILSLMHINKKNKKISMLVVKIDCNFYKKATSKVRFVCSNGDEISQIIDKCIKSKNGEIIKVNSKGFDSNGICVAEFNFTWSFKLKKIKI